MKPTFTLLLLSSLLYTVHSAAAQVRPDDIARIRREVRQTEDAASEAARDWSRTRRLPRRIVQRDGSLVELVGMSAGRPLYVTSVNDFAAGVTGTSHLYPGGRLGLDLTGTGLEVGVWDAGSPLRDHRELSGRVTAVDNAAVDDHATHVAGTIAASGLDRRARGMAYESTIRAYSWSNDATEMTNEGERGLLLSNHSYTIIAGWYYGDVEGDGDKWYWLGDPRVSTSEDHLFGYYDVPAVQFDRVAYSSPYYLPVVAAGNERTDRGPSSGTYRALDTNGSYQTYDVSSRPIRADGADQGFDTVSGAGVAKNVLTVGSIGLNNFDKSPRLSSFSSFGPTDDGRIKPDIVGVGEAVYSLSSNGSGAYQLSSGTSMAAPNVTGSLLLLQQYYSQIHGEYMRASTLKGLAIHTAADLGNRGPDYSTGWGLLDAEAAANQITSSVTNPAAILEEVLSDGSSFTREVTVEEPGALRLTLAWTDHASVRLAVLGAAALDNPTPHLRNDLDVRVVHSSTGTVYMPFVLDPRDPSREAGTGDNRLDPVEQVFIADPDTGAYVITVTHKGRLYSGMDQPFSIILSGAGDNSFPVAVSHLVAEATLEGVTLTWSTLFENRPGTFIVERAPLAESSSKRQSDDRFVAVGSVEAPASGGRSYEFRDAWSIAGRYVYRIVHDDGANRFIAGSASVNLIPPEDFGVLSSYPNPFLDQTTVILDLPKTQDVTIDIYDALGRRVMLLHRGVLEGGRHRLTVSASNWSAGVYFARIATPNGVTSHRMVLLR